MKRSRKRRRESSLLLSLSYLAVPIILANVLQSAYQLTDAYWVGRLGSAAVAAVSVSFPMIFLLVAIGGGLAIAGSALIAQYEGAKDHRMVNHVAAQTLLLISGVSIALSVVGWFFSPHILSLMGVDQVVFADALGFMRVSFAGLIFVFGFIMFQSIMRGVGDVTMPLIIVFGTVVLNFLLDPLLIFGWNWIPGFGVTGSAMATFITQAIAMGIGLAIMFRGRHAIRLRVSYFKPDLAFMKKAFLLGFPASVEQSARALGVMIMVFLVASFGTVAVASFGVGSYILESITIPALGFSLAVSTLVGQQLGAGNIKKAAVIAQVGATASLVTLTAIGIIVYLFAPSIITFFVPDVPAVVETGSVFIRIMALTFGLIGLQMALSGVLRASGNMLAAMLITVVSQWVIQFPLAFILSKNAGLGLGGIWWSYPVTNMVIALMTLIWYQKGDWKRSHLTQTQQRAEEVTEAILAEEPGIP